MRRPWAIALCVALPLACAYLVWQPPAGDLAAAAYRSDLFARAGFSTWDTGWYAAHGYWLPSYSLLSPGLGALLGVRVLLVLSALAASVLFALIAERVFVAGGVPEGTGRAPVLEAGGVPASRSGMAHLLEANGAQVASIAFALGIGVGMLSGRVPFDLGLAIGLGAVLALLRGALPLALALAVLAGAASPVAGAFLALGALAGADGLYSKWRGPRARARLLNNVSDVLRPRARAASPNGHNHPSRPRTCRRHPSGPATGQDRPCRPTSGHDPLSQPATPQLTQGGPPPRVAPRSCLALALAALAPVVVLSLAYPNGGYEPFAAGAFWPALGGVVLIALLLPRGSLSERGLRTVHAGAALYALALVAAYAIHTPMGGNAARLGALLAAPLLAGVLWPGHRRALLLLAVPLLYWQLVTPIRDYAALAGDPSTSAAYYAPLLSELRQLEGDEAVRGGRRRFEQGAHDRVAQGGGAIVEVPLTKAHWEAAYLAGHDGVRLARGWERQLDTWYAALFYRPSLPPAAYRAWLRENRVTYVALPDAPLDRAGRLEGALVARGLPYLRELWRSRHWRLYRFMG